jgi:hypothetical protein
MVIDCFHPPPWIVAIGAAGPTIKVIGPTLGILGAAAAWLINRFLVWCVWMIERFLRRRELMKALQAEIISNSEAEAVYYPGNTPAGQTSAAATKLIDSLRRQIGPYKPLAPYVATAPGNPIYEKAIDSISLLPSAVINAIVGYYSASVSLTNQLLDFREEAYLKLSQRRQGEVIAMVWDVIGREVEKSANAAKETIERALRKSDAILIGLVLSGVVASLAAFVGVAPHIVSAGTSFKQAAIWVSSCPSTPKAP